VFDDVIDVLTSNNRHSSLRYTNRVNPFSVVNLNASSGTDTVSIDSDTRLESDQIELTGEFQINEYRSSGYIDSVVEPVSFSVSANGELGLIDGAAIPFNATLNHPFAGLYDLDATIGADRSYKPAKG
jgi:hypothetical protein